MKIIGKEQITVKIGKEAEQIISPITERLNEAPVEMTAHLRAPSIHRLPKIKHADLDKDLKEISMALEKEIFSGKDDLDAFVPDQPMVTREAGPEQVSIDNLDRSFVKQIEKLADSKTGDKDNYLLAFNTYIDFISASAKIDITDTEKYAFDAFNLGKINFFELYSSLVQTSDSSNGTDGVFNLALETIANNPEPTKKEEMSILTGAFKRALGFLKNPEVDEVLKLPEDLSILDAKIISKINSLAEKVSEPEKSSASATKLDINLVLKELLGEEIHNVLNSGKANKTLFKALVETIEATPERNRINQVLKNSEAKKPFELLNELTKFKVNAPAAADYLNHAINSVVKEHLGQFSKGLSPAVINNFIEKINNSTESVEAIKSEPLIKHFYDSLNKLNGDYNTDSLNNVLSEAKTFITQNPDSNKVEWIKQIIRPLASSLSQKEFINISTEKFESLIDNNYNDFTSLLNKKLDFLHLKEDIKLYDSNNNVTEVTKKFINSGESQVDNEIDKIDNVLKHLEPREHLHQLIQLTKQKEISPLKKDILNGQVLGIKAKHLQAFSQGLQPNNVTNFIAEIKLVTSHKGIFKSDRLIKDFYSSLNKLEVAYNAEGSNINNKSVALNKVLAEANKFIKNNPDSTRVHWVKEFKTIMENSQTLLNLSSEQLKFAPVFKKLAGLEPREQLHELNKLKSVNAKNPAVIMAINIEITRVKDNHLDSFSTGLKNENISAFVSKVKEVTSHKGIFTTDRLIKDLYKSLDKLTEAYNSNNEPEKSAALNKVLAEANKFIKNNPDSTRINWVQAAKKLLNTEVLLTETSNINKGDVTNIRKLLKDITKDDISLERIVNHKFDKTTFKKNDFIKFINMLDDMDKPTAEKVLFNYLGDDKLKFACELLNINRTLAEKHLFEYFNNNEINYFQLFSSFTAVLNEENNVLKLYDNPTDMYKFGFAKVLENNPNQEKREEGQMLHNLFKRIANEIEKKVSSPEQDLYMDAIYLVGNLDRAKIKNALAAFSENAALDITEITNDINQIKSDRQSKNIISKTKNENYLAQALTEVFDSTNERKELNILLEKIADKAPLDKLNELRKASFKTIMAKDNLQEEVNLLLKFNLEKIPEAISYSRRSNFITDVKEIMGSDNKNKDFFDSLDKLEQDFEKEFKDINRSLKNVIAEAEKFPEYSAFLDKIKVTLESTLLQMEFLENIESDIISIEKTENSGETLNLLRDQQLALSSLSTKIANYPNPEQMTREVKKTLESHKAEIDDKLIKIAEQIEKLDAQNSSDNNVVGTDTFADTKNTPIKNNQDEFIDNLFKLDRATAENQLLEFSKTNKVKYSDFFRFYMFFESQLNSPEISELINKNVPVAMENFSEPLVKSELTFLNRVFKRIKLQGADEAIELTQTLDLLSSEQIKLIKRLGSGGENSDSSALIEKLFEILGKHICDKFDKFDKEKKVRGLFMALLDIVAATPEIYKLDKLLKKVGGETYAQQFSQVSKLRFKMPAAIDLLKQKTDMLKQKELLDNKKEADELMNIMSVKIDKKEARNHLNELNKLRENATESLKPLIDVEILELTYTHLNDFYQGLDNNNIKSFVSKVKEVTAHKGLLKTDHLIKDLYTSLGKLSDAYQKDPNEINFKHIRTAIENSIKESKLFLQKNSESTRCGWVKEIIKPLENTLKKKDYGKYAENIRLRDKANSFDKLYFQVDPFFDFFDNNTSDKKWVGKKLNFLRDNIRNIAGTYYVNDYGQKT